MTKSALTLFFFAFYLFGLGAVLLVAPNWLLGLFEMTGTTEVWIRVVGMLVVFIGVYYLIAAKHNFLPVMEASVKVRVAVLLFFAAFVALNWAPSALLLFGGVDLAGAVWTYLTLRSEFRVKDAPA
jgi:hypothetical protein